MIVSHRHKFIFLKTRKTAGTSLEVALSSLCGPDDIITVIRQEDEDARTQLGYPGPQNYLVPMHRYGRREWRRMITEGRRATFYNHIPARETKAFLGSRVWNSYFKFCFERNPWDRIVSGYFFRMYQTGDPTLAFSDFLAQQRPRTLSNSGIYTLDAKLAVDFVGRFEHLVEDFATALTALGVRDQIQLPRLKAKARSDRRPYREFFTPEQRRYIAEHCRMEINLLGYQFE